MPNSGFPSLTYMLANVIGVGLFHHYAASLKLPLPLLLTLLSLGILAGIYFLRHFQSDSGTQYILKIALTFFLSMAVGWGYTQIRANHRLGELLAPEHMSKVVDINVTVDHYPYPLNNDPTAPSSFRYDVKVDNPLPGIPSRLRLTERQVSSPMPAGSRWRLKVRLFPLHGGMNPHAFDYEAWLFEQGFGATGIIQARLQSLTPAIFSISRWQETLMQRLENFATSHHQTIPDIVPVLGLGIQAQLPQADWETLRVSGTLHLFSISGIHVTLLALLLGWCCQHLWAWSARITPRLIFALPAWWAGRWLALAVAWSYGALSGMGLPTQRTLLMMTLFTLIHRLGWRINALHLALFTLFAMTLFDPWAVLAPGFWLSFAGTLILMSQSPQASDLKKNQHPATLMQRFFSQTISAIRLQAHISLVLTPLLVIFFQQWAPASFFANLIAVPWVSLVLLPLTLMVVITPQEWLLSSLNILQLAFFNTMQWINEFLPSISSSIPHPFALLFTALGCLLLILPRGTPAKWLGIPLILPLLAGIPPTPIPKGHAVVTMLDVGAGLSVLVRTQHHHLLYDTGPENDRYSAITYALLPMLRGEGISTIDTLILSHADKDHAGGAVTLMQSLPIRQIITGGRHEDWQQNSSQSMRKTISQKNIPWKDCQNLAPWEWDGVRFTPMMINHHAKSDPLSDENLYPSQASGQHLSENNASCALKISTPPHAFLLSADLEQAGLKYFTEHYGNELKSQVLQIPHHGSDTSSFPPFYQSVAPHFVLLSGGPQQRHYPAPRMTNALIALPQAPWLFHTWYDGAIQFTLSPNTPPNPQGWRHLNPRYWHSAIRESYRHRTGDLPRRIEQTPPS